MDLGRVTLKQNKKICAGVDGVEVKPFIKNLVVDVASDIDDVRFRDLELLFNRREFQRVDEFFLRRVVTVKDRYDLLFKISIVETLAAFRKD